MSALWELRVGTQMFAYIQARPNYCDRGRWHANVEVAHFKSDSDPWPRYYFDLEAAKSEVLAYCRAKKINVDDARWTAV